MRPYYMSQIPNYPFRWYHLYHLCELIKCDTSCKQLDRCVLPVQPPLIWRSLLPGLFKASTWQGNWSGWWEAVKKKKRQSHPKTGLPWIKSWTKNEGNFTSSWSGSTAEHKSVKLDLGLVFMEERLDEGGGQQRLSTSSTKIITG